MMIEPKNGEWWMCDRGGVNAVFLRLENDWRGDNNDTYSFGDAIPLHRMIEDKPIQPKPESDYDRGMRKAMQAIAKSCGKVFGADVGYDDLPALVESLLNPPKPKPPVRVEYEKVTESIFDLKDEFERGELYCKNLAGNDDFQLLRTVTALSGCYSASNIYRRIEKPVDWRELTIEFADKCGFHGIGGITLHHSDRFLEMCRIALRANGEL